MTFIITLISLIIERFFHWSHLRQWRWFGRYQRMIGTRISQWPSWAILLVCILPLLIVVGLINAVLDHHVFGIPKIIFGVIVLVYCMGPENLWVQTFSCINTLNKEDPQLAIDQASKAFGIAEAPHSQGFHRALTSAIFVEAHRRVFAVVFWFVVLGPVGAVLYRALELCAGQSDLGLTVVANKAHKALDWIPARLFTFLFALGGHFVGVLNNWKKDAKSNMDMNDKLIAECGLAAIESNASAKISEDGSAEKAALELLDRVFIITLLILAMVVIIVK
jgi:membrane protein required for beta-lactamase induction